MRKRKNWTIVQLLPSDGNGIDHSLTTRIHSYTHPPAYIRHSAFKYIHIVLLPHSSNVLEFWRYTNGHNDVGYYLYWKGQQTSRAKHVQCGNTVSTNTTIPNVTTYTAAGMIQCICMYIETMYMLMCIVY